MLIHDYFTSAEYALLSPRAVKALVDIYTQFRGKNNGDLCAAWKIMAPLGWTSKDQLAKALQELLNAGWIVITRMGGNRLARLYGVTWLGIDHCAGKLDVTPNPVPVMLWKTISASRPAGHSVPPCGSKVAANSELRPALRVISGPFQPSYDPPHGTLYRSSHAVREFEQGLEQWETDGGNAIAANGGPQSEFHRSHGESVTKP